MDDPLFGMIASTAVLFGAAAVLGIALNVVGWAWRSVRDALPPSRDQQWIEEWRRKNGEWRRENGSDKSTFRS